MAQVEGQLLQPVDTEPRYMCSSPTTCEYCCFADRKVGRRRGATCMMPRSNVKRPFLTRRRVHTLFTGTQSDATMNNILLFCPRRCVFPCYPSFSMSFWGASTSLLPEKYLFRCSALFHLHRFSANEFSVCKKWVILA